ncbi:ABC transporter permease [Cumulibacter soli]|uniref:ABC transporter permease n=1 Tax=Cumulibacter soli TaxID=2546344 RepID=UPI00106854BF|nr:ABC transporter permease [Cumulibacter soli]
MATFLEFAVLGLGLAAVYIGLGTGLQLVYRATGIVNFAQGAMGMWGAYVYAQLQKNGELVLPFATFELDDPGVSLSLLIALVVAVVLGILAHYLVFRPVRRAPALAQVVVSIGLMVILQALATIQFGPNHLNVDAILPRGSIELFGANLATPELIMTAIMLVLAALVWAYFRFTYWGAATRAASENERGAILMGFSPDRLSLIALIMSTLISTVGVVLASSLTGLSPTNYALMVVPALAVFLAARLESIAVICVGAIVLGVFQSEIGLLATKDWWPTWAKSGLDQVIPFVAVMVILVIFGGRLPARGSLASIRLPDVHVPRFRIVPAATLFVVAGALIFIFDSTYRFAFTFSLIMGLLALSYVLITGYLGQISLAQLAFAGTAGFALSKITTNWGLPFPIAIVISALLASAVGLIVALPAFRIRGVQLAIVTLAAALAIERFVFGNYSLTPVQGNPIADPVLFGIDFSVRTGRELSRPIFSLLVLVVLTIMIVIFVCLARGDTGRSFLAVRANERAAASAGINVRRTKAIGFAVSAFFAGIAGCLIGYSVGQLSAESFSVMVGIQLLAVAYLGGITSFGGALVAGMLAPLGLIYTALHSWFEMGDYYPLITGIGLVVTAILNPVGIAGEFGKQVAWVGSRFRRNHDGDDATAPEANKNEEPAHV